MSPHKSQTSGFGTGPELQGPDGHPSRHRTTSPGLLCTLVRVAGSFLCSVAHRLPTLCSSQHPIRAYLGVALKISPWPLLLWKEHPEQEGCCPIPATFLNYPNSLMPTSPHPPVVSWQMCLQQVTSPKFQSLLCGLSLASGTGFEVQTEWKLNISLLPFLGPLGVKSSWKHILHPGFHHLTYPYVPTDVCPLICHKVSSFYS